MGYVARKSVKVRYCRYGAAGSKPGLKLRNAGVCACPSGCPEEVSPQASACGDRTATELGKLERVPPGYEHEERDDNTT